MATWGQLLDWIQDKSRTNEDLNDAVRGILPNKEIFGNPMQKRKRLRDFISVQDLDGTASWRPEALNGAPPGRRKRRDRAQASDESGITRPQEENSQEVLATEPLSIPAPEPVAATSNGSGEQADEEPEVPMDQEESEEPQGTPDQATGEQAPEGENVTTNNSPNRRERRGRGFLVGAGLLGLLTAVGLSAAALAYVIASDDGNDNGNGSGQIEVSNNTNVVGLGVGSKPSVDGARPSGSMADADSGKSPAPSTGVSSGVTSQTNCGMVTWGPAGAAPGAFTSDSAKQVTEAVQIMDIDLASAEHVAVHKFCPGDDTPNGWIVGSSWTEANGVRVTANFLPAGVCIDYDHNVTQITGEVFHTQVLNPRWSRTQIMSDGAATGLKFTVYWTPCVFTDGTPSWEGDGSARTQETSSTRSTTMVAPAPSGSGCPMSAQEVANRTGSAASDWTQHPQLANGWIYNGPVIDGFDVPAGGKVDYDGGIAESGDVPSGSAFTYWCPK